MPSLKNLNPSMPSLRHTDWNKERFIQTHNPLNNLNNLNESAATTFTSSKKEKKKINKGAQANEVEWTYYSRTE